MTVATRVGGSVAFSVSATLVLMFAVSRFPGMAIPLPYWIFGTLCPAVISFTVALLLARQTERIRELQGQRDEFVRLLSHDMRAPQASILALLDDPAEDCDPDLARRIRACATRTLKLADDMVHLSRAQVPDYPLQEIDLAGIVEDAVDALAPQARAKRITFARSAGADIFPLRGEPALLARALINLLDNAVKFSPAGSVVRLGLDRVSRGQRDWIACTVSDQGPGFAPASPAGRGAGLGLTLVRTVVRRHGGTLACRSRPDSGATVRIELPAAE